MTAGAKVEPPWAGHADAPAGPDAGRHLWVLLLLDDIAKRAFGCQIANHDGARPLRLVQATERGCMAREKRKAVATMSSVFPIACS